MEEFYYVKSEIEKKAKKSNFSDVTRRPPAPIGVLWWRIFASHLTLLLVVEKKARLSDG